MRALMAPLAGVARVDYERVYSEPDETPQCRLVYLMWCGADLLVPLMTDAGRFPAAERLQPLLVDRGFGVVVCLLAQAYGRQAGDGEAVAFLQQSQFTVPPYILERLDAATDADSLRLEAEKTAVWYLLPAEPELLGLLDGDERRAARTRHWERVAPQWQNAVAGCPRSRAEIDRLAA